MAEGQGHVREGLPTVVVGGGAGGLAIAQQRLAAGRPVVLFEAAAAAGGLARRVGRGWEHAASPGPLLVAGRSGLAPLYPGAANPLQGTAARVLDRLRARRARERPTAAARSRRAETLAAWAVRHLGPHALASWVDALARWQWGAPAASLGAVEALPLSTCRSRSGAAAVADLLRDPGRELLWQTPGHWQARVATLAADLGDRLVLGRRVVALQRPSPADESVPPSADEAIVVLLDSGRAVLAADVVLAVPPAEQARLLRPLDAVAADVLAGMASAPRLAVFASWRGDTAAARLLGAAPRTVGCVRGTLPLRASGFWAMHEPGAGRLVLHYGGHHDSSPLGWSDERVERTARRDAAWIHGTAGQLQVEEAFRDEQALTVLAPGLRGRLAALEVRLEPLRIQLAGAHVTGHASDLLLGTRHGAAAAWAGQAS